jgi:peptidoglycan-associated lipoprotein
MTCGDPAFITKEGGMRRVGLLLVAVGLVAAGCAATTTTVYQPPTPGIVDITGKWVGTWQGYDVLGTPRTEDATADFLQQGSRGTGRLALHTTGVVTAVPVTLRNAGLTGVRVEFRVSGSEVVMRHALGASLFTADLFVDGDRMTGYVRDAKPSVRIALTRAKPSMPVAAAPPPTLPPPAAPPAPAPVEPPKAPEPIAAAPAEPGRPEPKEFTEVPELKPIYFDFDKYDIRPEDAKILESNAEWLKANAEMLVQIEGHCDPRGTPEYNIALGERRARAARNHLIASGVAADRISTVSFGSEHPVCSEATEECWAKNRRAIFLVKPR